MMLELITLAQLMCDTHAKDLNIKLEECTKAFDVCVYRKLWEIEEMSIFKKDIDYSKLEREALALCYKEIVLDGKSSIYIKDSIGI